MYPYVDGQSGTAIPASYVVTSPPTQIKGNVAHTNVTEGSDANLVVRTPGKKINDGLGGDYAVGARILTTQGETSTTIEFPKDGFYEIATIAFGQQGGNEPVKMELRDGLQTDCVT